MPFSGFSGPCLQRGVSVQIACGPGHRGPELLSRIEQDCDRSTGLRATSPRPDYRVSIVCSATEKALVTDTWAVYGSMNLTYSGVTMNGELITVTTDAAKVAAVATELRGLFT